MTQFYINGVIADLGDAKINLSYKSPIFSDLQTLVANTSLSIKLPMSAHNSSIIANINVAGVQSSFPYNYFRADIVEDGFTIVAGGIGYVLSISNTIEVSVIFGGIAGMAKAKDARLRDLVAGDAHGVIAWDNSSQWAQMGFTEDITFLYTYFGYDDGTMRYAHPSVRVSKVVEWINETFGLRIAQIGKRMFLPCITKNRHTQARDAAFFTSTPSVVLHTLNAGVNFDNNWIRGSFSYHTEQGRLVLGSKGLYRLSATMTYNGQQPEQVTTFVVKNHNTDQEEIYEKDSADGYCDVELDRDCQYSFFATVRSVDTRGAILDFHIAPVDDNILFGEQFDVSGNLPDISVMDFLKAIMQINGVFPQLVDGAIEFVSVDHLYQNIPRAVDWSGKLIEVKSTSFRFLNFGQQNSISWTEDETVSIEATQPGLIYVDNKTIEPLYQCVKLPFAASEVVGGGVATVPIYKEIIEKDEPTVVEYQTVKPRILALGTQPCGYPIAAPIIMSEILDNYSAYQKVIRRPQIVKCVIMLTARDIAQLDLLIPIYIEQLGGHFAAINITTKQEGAEVELLKL